MARSIFASTFIIHPCLVRRYRPRTNSGIELNTIAPIIVNVTNPFPAGRSKRQQSDTVAERSNSTKNKKTKKHARIGVSAAEKAQRALRSGNVLKHQPPTDPTTNHTHVIKPIYPNSLLDTLHRG